MQGVMSAVGGVWQAAQHRVHALTHREDHQHLSPAGLVAGWVGGVTYTVTLHPFDTIKVVAQMQDITSLAAARNVFEEFGVRGFYRGVMAPVLGIGGARAIMFGTYQQTLSYATTRHYERLAEEHQRETERQRQIARDAEAQLPIAQQVSRRAARALGLRKDPLLTEDCIDPQDLHKTMQNSAGLPMHITTACATVSGLAFSTALTPFDVVKVRLITENHFDHREYNGALDCARQLWAQGGVRKLWRGYYATVLRDVPHAIVTFGSYGTIRRAADDYICPLTGEKGVSLAAGGLAGVAGWLLVYPLDTVKTRIQAGRQQQPWSSVVNKLYVRRGVAGFYSGITPMLIRVFCSNAICFGAVEATLSVIQELSGPAPAAPAAE